MRFISTNIHGLFDYIIGALLIAMPWLMGLAAIGGPETWVPVIIGVGVIFYSVLTDYEWGLFPRIETRIHLGFDILAGATLLFSVIFFGFFDVTYWLPYLAIGLLIIAAGFFTEKEPRSSKPRFQRPETLETTGIQ